MDKENYFNVKINNSSEVYEDYEDSQTSFVMSVIVAIFGREKKIFLSIKYSSKEGNGEEREIIDSGTDWTLTTKRIYIRVSLVQIQVPKFLELFMFAYRLFISRRKTT